MITYSNVRDLDEGLILIGWTCDEEQIRYERETNRVFVREYDIEGVKYLAIGKLITVIETSNGKLIPLVASNSSLHREISQFLSPEILKVE